MEYSQEILMRLRQMLGSDLLSESKFDPNIYRIIIQREKVREITNYLTKEVQGRLIHISTIDKGLDGYEVVYHYAFDHLDKFFHLNVKVLLAPESLEIESVSSEAPQSSWSEKEMMEFTPVKFIGHPDPRHLWLPYEWPNSVEDEKCVHYVDKTDQPNMQIRAQENTEYSLIPLGPYHPLLIEGAYFRVKLDGEEITDVDIKLGWNHRGIMKLFESRSYTRGVFLAERICGICNVTHTTAYLNAIESLSGIDVPIRARYIRTLMAELERIHSHLLWLGVAGDRQSENGAR
jgi:Ni,Fe-hydrogenase III component G